MHKYGLSTPHTSHCSPTGEIVISTMGNPDGDGLGEFFCIDAETLETKGTWSKGQVKADFGYDFWYQPYHDMLIASEWGTPKIFKEGFIPRDVYDPSRFSIARNFMTKLFNGRINLSKYHLLTCRNLWKKLEYLFVEWTKVEADHQSGRRWNRASWD